MVEGNAVLTSLEYPDIVPENTPITILYSIQNQGDTDVLFGKIYQIISGTPVLLDEWRETFNTNEIKNKMLNFPDGIIDQLNITMEIGHEDTSCSSHTDYNECINAGCYWYNMACHETPMPCDQYINPVDCANNGCYWYDDACHSDPSPDQICYWVSDKGGPTALTITDTFEIIDAYVLQTTPGGYAFIPTLEQTFGITDYYLGFIDSGNTKTGCNF